MTNGEYQQLVEFLGRQFTGIDRQFAAINQRFATMDRRFDSLQEHIDGRFREVFGHFDAIYAHFERLEQEYHAITQGLRRIEALLADETIRRQLLEHGLAELKEQVALLQARISELEQRLQS